MTRKRFRLKSFKYAFEGLLTLLRREPNSRVHLAAGIIAIAAGIFFHISAVQWLFVALSISLVFSCELFNSAVEKMADLIDEKQNIDIKYIKDLSAAGVLVAAIFSLVVAAVIFIPCLIRAFN